MEERRNEFCPKNLPGLSNYELFRTIDLWLEIYNTKMLFRTVSLIRALDKAV